MLGIGGDQQMFELWMKLPDGTARRIFTENLVTEKLATNDEAKASLAGYTASEIENNVLTCKNLYHIRNLLGGAGGGALNYDMVLQTNHAEPWNDGTAATLQSLARPHSGQWLDNARFDLKAYNGALSGISKTSGGIHFDWTDTAVASVDMMFEVEGGGGSGVGVVAGEAGVRQSELEFSIGGLEGDGMAVAGSLIYVWAANGDVRIYNTNGIVQSTITLTGGPAHTRGLAVGNSKIYVIDSSNIKIYPLAGGSEITAERITLDTNNSSPFGLAFTNGFVYVVDADDDKVYAYNVATRARDSSKEFDLAPGNTDARGITFGGNTFFVVDGASSTDEVYAYTPSGTFLSELSFTLPAVNANPQGIAYRDNVLYVSDTTDDYIYAYAVGLSPRFGLVKTSGGIGELAVATGNSFVAFRLRSGVVTVSRNDYLLFAGTETLAPFRVMGSVLQTN